MFSLEDKIAVVTGGASGIGEAIAIDGGMSAGPGLGMIGALYEKIAGEALEISGDAG